MPRALFDMTIPSLPWSFSSPSWSDFPIQVHGKSHHLPFHGSLGAARGSRQPSARFFRQLRVSSWFGDEIPCKSISYFPFLSLSAASLLAPRIPHGGEVFLPNSLRSPTFITNSSTSTLPSTFPAQPQALPKHTKMSPTETYKPAFLEPPSSKVSGTAETSSLVSPYISYGLPYTEAYAKHVTETFKCSRVYIVASGTLSRETDRLELLIEAVEAKNVKVIGVKKGMRPHTPWTQIIEISSEARAGNADCIVTLGAGSLTDGAKIVVLVRTAPFPLSCSPTYFLSEAN
jgi:hypothetical protein